MKRLLLFLLLALLACHGLAAAEIFVGKDGSADFESIQAALDVASPGDTIWIAPGSYRERVVVETPHISLIGGGGEWNDTNIVSNIPSGQVAHARDSATLQVSADHVSVANLSIKNCSFEGPGHTIAAWFEGDHFEVVGVRFIGESDTLGLHGQGVVEDSFVAGRSDFVFGRGLVTFIDTRLHVRYFGDSTRGVIVAQGRQEKGEKSGFFFSDCRVTSDREMQYHLARPWQPYSLVSIFGTYIGDGCLEEGFRNDKEPEREKTAFFVECGNRGPGSGTDRRVSWARHCD